MRCQLDAAAPETWKQAQAAGRVELAALDEMIAAAVAPAPPAAGDTKPPPIPAAPAPSAHERNDAKRRMYLPGLILIGLGGASLIAGSVVGPLALHEKNNALAASCDDSMCPEAQESAIERNYDKARALGRSADALLIGGAVLATAGVVLVLVARPEKGRLSLAPAPGGALLNGSF